MEAWDRRNLWVDCSNLRTDCRKVCSDCSKLLNHCRKAEQTKLPCEGFIKEFSLLNWQRSDETSEEDKRSESEEARVTE